MLATAPWQKPPLGWKPDPDKLAAVGAVAWYMFNEGGGLTALDASGFDHHGSLGAGNAAPAWAPSPHGGGLVFDKIDDVVNCG